MSRPEDPYGYQAQEIYDKLAADAADAEARGELDEEPTPEEITSILRDMQNGDIIAFPNGVVAFRDDTWEVSLPDQEPGADGHKPTAEEAFRNFLRGEG
jgi:hypothetical protein